MLSHETQGILTVNEEVGLNADITNSTLIVANTSVGSSGIYWCNVTGEGKNIRSHSGVLTVQGEQLSIYPLQLPRIIIVDQLYTINFFFITWQSCMKHKVINNNSVLYSMDFIWIFSYYSSWPQGDHNQSSG